MTRFWKRCHALLRSLLIATFTMTLPAYALMNADGIQVFDKRGPLSENPNQSLEAALDHYYNAENIWDVLRAEFSLPHYENNPLVQRQITWFLHNRDFLLRCANRASPYLYFIAQQVRIRHLPAEIVLLPVIESAYNPFAHSSAGAAGLWQMMPGTATGFGVKQNDWYDGRRDIVASTQAALNYLVYLGGFFEGNWLLAIAAYDTGEGNVLAAIRRNVSQGQHTDFWSLPVAEETRLYIPRLLALATIIAHPERYAVYFPPVKNAPYLAQINVSSPMDLHQAAHLAGMKTADMRQLNPGLNYATLVPGSAYHLLLPIANVEQFTANIAQSSAYHDHHGAPYTLHPGDTLYMVRQGDNAKAIAKRFRVPLRSLLAANQLRSALLPLAVGEKIMVPTHLPPTSYPMIN